MPRAAERGTVIDRGDWLFIVGHVLQDNRLALQL